MLADLLAAVRSVPDLAPVFEALGYTADVRSLEGNELLVARWKGFEVLALEATRPDVEARASATRLAAASRRAMVAVVGAGELCIAAPRLGAGGSTRVLTVTLTRPGVDALRLLERLSPRGAPH